MPFKNGGGGVQHYKFETSVHEHFNYGNIPDYFGPCNSIGFSPKYWLLNLMFLSCP